MGFYSQDCHRCGHPLLSRHACTKNVNEWMTQAVSISESGNLHTGEYDGYGRIDGAEDAVGSGGTVFHRACWELAGKPTEHQGPSPDSDDQGYFFDDEDHAMLDPRTHPPRVTTRPQRT